MDIAVIDVKGYGTRGSLEQRAIRRALHEALSTAAGAVGAPHSSWRYQDQGDGGLALVPPEVPRPRLVGDWTRELGIALRDCNRSRRPEERIRLRVAIHHGLVFPDGGGFAGTAVVEASRLGNACQARAALEAAPEADLVLIVSDPVYDSVVREGYRGLDGADFQRVHVVEKEYGAVAWVSVPGLKAATLPDLDRAAPCAGESATASPDHGASSPPPRADAGPSGGGQHFHGLVQGPVNQGTTVIGEVRYDMPTGGADHE